MGMILLFCIGLLIYFLPSLMARNHPNSAAIFVLNLFLGWSVIGWVVALVWAFTVPAEAMVAPPSIPLSPDAPMRACPYCAEAIQPNAIKCKHCGSDLVTDPRALLGMRLD